MATSEQILQILRPMFGLLMTTQQTHTEALTEAIKNMHKGSSTDSGSTWRGLKAPPDLFDGRDSKWAAVRYEVAHIHDQP